MNREFISIKNIANELYSKPMMADLPFERIINDTIELMQITGCPTLFETKEEVLEIKDWRTLLPCDYYQINQLMTEEDNHSYRVFKESTDTFSLTESSKGYTYTIKGRVLYTSIKEGKVRISYQAIKLDEEGFPLIINNASYLRALKSYIKMNWFTDLFDAGRISGEVLANAQADYYGHIAQAQNSLLMPDLAQMENIAIIVNDAFTRNHNFYSHYQDLNKEHSFRTH